MGFKYINVCDCKKKGGIPIKGKGSNCLVPVTNEMCDLCLHYVQVKKVPIDWEPNWGLLESSEYKIIKDI